jgi:hypothetical protein
MNLDEAQRAKVAEWIEQGLKLSEIQNKLVTEYGLRLTYMDVRFLIDDLKLRVKDVEPPKPSVPIAPAPAAQAPTEGQPGPADLEPMPDEPAGPLGNVTVVVDQLARAGSLVSGKVTFSDGKTAEWFLDQSGRLGLAAQDKGYRPSQQDVMAFQTELQTQLAKFGY